MEYHSFIEVISRYLSKARLLDIWSFSCDENKEPVITLDQDGFLVFHSERTPYNIACIERVKYGYGFNSDHYVALDMIDGCRLRIGKNDREAYIRLQTEKRENIYLYKSRQDG